MQSQEPLLKVDNLCKFFPIRSGLLARHVGDIRAVDGVSFSIEKGTCLGLVGESGCGKTTVGRTVIALYRPTSGQVHFRGQPLFDLPPKTLRRLRRQMQIVFQDPIGSLNPRMTVLDIVGDAMEVHGLASRRDKESRVQEILQKVGLSPDCVSRYPHEFSGGQRQRIGIARALALQPKLIVCDEAVSALDVSVRAQIINLLSDLQHEMGLTYLFISHDLSVIRHISQHVCVMYLGRIIEQAPTDTLFANPLHPYTQALLSAVPSPFSIHKPLRTPLPGEVPSPIHPPSGCHFHPRCPHRMPRCQEQAPRPIPVAPGHQVACHLHDPCGR